MRVRSLIVCLVCALAGLSLVQTAAMASDSPKKADSHDSGGHDTGGEKKGIFASSDNVVDLPAIITPVVSSGRINAYLYIYVVAVTDDITQAQALKSKMAYVQDALVREAYREALVMPRDGSDPNIDALLTRIQAKITELVHFEKPVKLAVDRIDTAPY